MGPLARSYRRQLAAAAAAARRRASSARGNTTKNTRKEEKDGERGRTRGSHRWDPMYTTWAFGTVGSAGALYTCLRDYVDKSVQLAQEQTLNVIIKVGNERLQKEKKNLIAQADQEKSQKKTPWRFW